VPRPSSHPGLSSPARDRWPTFALAAGVAAAALFLLIALRAGDTGREARAAAPPVRVDVQVPAQATAPVTVTPQQARDEPSPTRAALDEQRFLANDRHHVRASWVAGFFPLYEASAKAHGVPWVLLASIHKQETAFSTHPTTYRGLNFAKCCGGPMQFNVTNGDQQGGLSTWDRFKGAHKRAPRPQTYNHATRRHPSIYDDFDAIMAAGLLLQTAGAGTALDGAAWRAAYDYYGPDLVGVDYANQVLARAIGWARDGFCINCEVDPALVAAVDAAWGAPVRAQFAAAETAERRTEDRRERRARRKAQR
jgi:hypothetical protein